MKLHSFRLRIALLSAMLAGTALAGFAVVSLMLIYQAKLTRLDSDIKSQLLQQTLRRPENTNWPSYEKQLPSVLGTDPQTPIGVLVAGRQGETIYQSENWPASVDLAATWSPPSNQMPQQPRPFPPEPGNQPPPQFRQAAGAFGEPPPGSPEEVPAQPQFRQAAGAFGEPPPGLPEEVPAQLNDQMARQIKVMTKSTSNGAWRVGVLIPPLPRIGIAISLEGIDREMSAIRNGFLISVPVGLVAVAFGAWALSGTALRPLREVSAKIQQVSATGLNRRISTGTADVEFHELLHVFNQMMERLERSFKQASRFSADAAHELKTPLSILQGELERTLQRAEPGSELQQNMSHLLDEVSHLREIVRKLLLLSLADAGQMRLLQVEVNLSKILADLTEDVEMLAPDLQIFSTVEPALLLKGDRDLLLQILHNLTNNAIKYNLPKGWLRIEAQRKKGTIAVKVSNSSRDISARDRQRIFERFYRGDSSRTHQIEGLGLGLSLSREIARAHGGELKIDSTPAGQTAFTLTLPALQSI